MVVDRETHSEPARTNKLTKQHAQMMETQADRGAFALCSTKTRSRVLPPEDTFSHQVKPQHLQLVRRDPKIECSRI